MNRQQIIDYYSRDDILGEIMKSIANREVIGAFPDRGYDSRPNVVQYPSDIIQMTRKGVSSFHLSVEKWKYPMQLNSSLSRERLDELRTGWDLVIDIDSKIGMDGSKSATILVCDLLEKYGIKHYGVKFSGSRGFHVIIPSMMWPPSVDYKDISQLYPKIPQLVSAFIRSKIKKALMEEILKDHTIKELTEIIGDFPSELNPYAFVDVEKNWGSRHLFRSPYSLNEKTWLVSVPVRYNQIKDFSFDMAKPDKVKIRDFFMDCPGEAMNFLIDVMDWYAAKKKYRELKTEKKEIVLYQKRIPEELFPPCIKNILSGIKDGKKRSIFTLINFLKVMNWSEEEIKQRLFDWNILNTPSLQSNLIMGQLRWNSHQKKRITPANCFNDMFYTGIGVCKPDNNCKKIKNPVSYPFTKMDRKQEYKKVRGFSCDVCNKEFKNRRSMMQHRGRSH
ncbi:MAG: DNA primase small subunit domain-containing protein [Candidatus Aenigmatarchaeota archaeon]